MTIVRFNYHPRIGYKCNKSGDMSGEYVPLAEYQKLQSLIQRVNEVADDLSDEMEADDELRMYVTVRSDKLEQLLSDCKEVLA